MVAKMILTDAQINDWAKAAGLHIATNFDREMFRRFAEVVMKDVIHEDESVPNPRQKKKTDEGK